VAEPRLDLDCPAAPPRRNGELAFEAPWESRLFGVTLALCEAGRFEWEEFRALLIEEVARADAAGAAVRFHYYGCWQAAFERLVAAKGLCAGAELEARARALAARPAGHDHRHDHGHPHHDHSHADDRGRGSHEPRR
jgi:nitrile hydratase accessory protein